MPTPLCRIVPDIPQADARYDAIQYRRGLCRVQLKRSVTPHFWVNISDPRFEIRALEFSTCGRPATVVYILITCR
jgi:hypothetical protein